MKECSVKYEGVSYKVEFKDKIYIMLIEMMLLLKRGWRRIRNLILDNLLLLFLLTFAWTIFVFFVYIWGIYYYQERIYTPVEIMWDFKGSYFTSVILMHFTNSYNKISIYKSKIRKQNVIYMETLECFDELYRDFVGDHKLYYIIFYCKKCVNSTIKYIERQNYSEINYESIKNAIDKVIYQLNKVEKAFEMDDVVGGHEYTIEFISIARNKMTDLKKVDITVEKIVKELCDISYVLLNIVEDLRRPWRWDMNLNLKILNILNKNKDNKISEDFYYGMLLNGYNFS